MLYATAFLIPVPVISTSGKSVYLNNDYRELFFFHPFPDIFLPGGKFIHLALSLFAVPCNKIRKPMFPLFHR